MSRLLSPLDTLSQLHPEVFIQELASNLRAVIATHGAYKPDTVSSSAAHLSCNSDTTMQTKKKQKTSNKTSTSSSTSGGSSERETTNNIPARPSTPARARGLVTSVPPAKPLSDWFLEACDPDVPTRAFALRGLTQLVQSQDPEAVQAQEKVFVVGLFFISSECKQNVTIYGVCFR